MTINRLLLASTVIAGTLTFASPVSAQDFSTYSDEALAKYIAENGVAERKLLVPMRDGVGLSTDIYRPKAKTASVPIIFDRTPYNFNKLGGGQLRYVAEALSRGYAYVIQNERGRYFSQGKYQILGYPKTDGYDALTWLSARPWSNGKVGTIGCSSSAEWQLQLAGMNHPAHAAMVPMSAGAGIGRVGRFYEQGNWFTGGAQRNLFTVWIYGVDNPLRAELPATLTGDMRARIAAYNDLNPDKPKVDWVKQIAHLPVAETLSSLGEPAGTFEGLVKRQPNDPAWYQGGLYHDDLGWGVPALWFNSWYDVSIGPNMELYNHARKVNSDPEASANQYAVVAPVEHCRFTRMGKNQVVGARTVGDASFDTYGEVFRWFDRWLKGDKAAWPASTPKVRYFDMQARGEDDGAWKSAAQWPPKEATLTRLYLHSAGRANSLYGDGKLSFDAPTGDQPADRYRYDPMNPVQTIGGGDCCNGGIVTAGAFDQRVIEARNDVLVYTSDPLTAPLDIAGFISPVLHVSSDAKDTDFAVKLVDVAPDGTAWIIGDTMLRARYRDGYDKQVFMRRDEIYKLMPTPMTSAITFRPGHRIRIEISSSNFPKFVRNLNTGGDNVTEKTGVVADNAVHHSAAKPSYIELPIVR